MKSMRLDALRALLDQPAFHTFWTNLQALRREADTARRQQDDLLSQATLMDFRAELTQKNAIDQLYAASECEDAAAKRHHDSTDLENRSFKALAHFEEQRFKVSELWYRLGAAEKTLEEKREAMAKAQAKRAEVELRAAEKGHQHASADYTKEDARKTQLWNEVEALWAQSTESNLLVAEHRVRGQRLRKEAESLFALAEEQKSRARALRAEVDTAARALDAAQDRITALIATAKTHFGCAAGNDFLYFQHPHDKKRVVCVALIEDEQGYNLEVRPLGLYFVDRQRGVAFLEPATEAVESPDEGDRRFDDYFLTGRKASAIR
jgi:hypothetical protein